MTGSSRKSEIAIGTIDGATRQNKRSRAVMEMDMRQPKSLEDSCSSKVVVSTLHQASSWLPGAQGQC
jgi:hypothetical protein